MHTPCGLVRFRPLLPLFRSSVVGWSAPSLGPDEAEEEEREGLAVEIVFERV